MRTRTSEFDTKSEAAQNKPVELIDFYLGAQDTDDGETQHLAIYDRNIDFYNLDGGAQTYKAEDIKRSPVTHNMELRRDSVTLQIDNLDDAFTTLFWQSSRHLQDKRLVVRQVFADLLTDASHAVTIIDGIVDTVNINERICRMVVASYLGFVGFKTGVALDRICPISIFGSSRCAQDVSPATDLTQETTDDVDAGSTTTVIKVKTLNQADDFWNIGKFEFTSGANDGIVRKVIDWAQSTKEFTLDFPLPAAPAEDDTIKVLRDCDRTLKMCKERFTEVHATLGNSANFRGYNTVTTTINP